MNDVQVLRHGFCGASTPQVESDLRRRSELYLAASYSRRGRRCDQPTSITWTVQAGHDGVDHVSDGYTTRVILEVVPSARLAVHEASPTVQVQICSFQYWRAARAGRTDAPPSSL